MNFQNIPPIETCDFYLELAFRKAQEKADLQRQVNKQEWKEKSKTIELQKIRVIKDILMDLLDKIPKSFPNLDNLSEFYKELFKNSFDMSFLKKSLASTAWAARRVQDFGTLYDQRVKRCREPQKINVFGKEFHGRIASVIRKIKKELAYLEITRKALKDFPDFKEEFTVCIVGFPNIGKTTILNKITGTKAEVKAYAFTTKRLNIGYFTVGHHKIQVIDTPGSLNRFEKMNPIEKQAFLAIKYCANAIVYIYDLTEPYPLKDQEKLLKNIRELHKPVLQYVSKTDIIPKEEIEEFRGNKKIITDTNELKEEIIKIKEKKEE